MKKEKNILATYRCTECGNEMKFNHGPGRELPRHWRMTSCDRENPICGLTKKGIKKKTAKLIKTWKE